MQYRLGNPALAGVRRHIRPQAPHHVLVIAKGGYMTSDHFSAKASNAKKAERLLHWLRSLMF